ncbi:hypothetical protein GCM10023196_036410 [Actinoallomurus vinaceus]|uniref:Transcriptional regulator WhiB n=1 Tax=Actinoallomurus vinaceus TaxID=1080074 RepID=A0ABP8UCU8_9ACTN
MTVRQLRRVQSLWSDATPPVLLTLPTEEWDWKKRGVCASVDPELWFPERGQPGNQAKRICRDCPVRDECLTHALDEREPYGIWGGLSTRERKELLKARGVELDEDLVDDGSVDERHEAVAA